MAKTGFKARLAQSFCVIQVFKMLCRQSILVLWAESCEPLQQLEPQTHDAIVSCNMSASTSGLGWAQMGLCFLEGSGL